LVGFVAAAHELRPDLVRGARGSAAHTATDTSVGVGGWVLEAALVVTYRCNAQCYMCNTWQYPSQESEEFAPGDLRSLPALRFANITGGEPFLREDLADIVEVVREKAQRIVISTNGYLTDRVVALARRFPDIGFRISIEGLPSANDELRGLKDGFDHGMRTLLQLREIGCQDIGFGITVSDRNADDLLELAGLADAMGFELATAVVHNSYYFHKRDNVIGDPDRVASRFVELARRQVSSKSPKKWFRAWFNMGLANKAHDGSRALPCGMGSDMFFVDPFGVVRPCNGTLDEDGTAMGSLRDATFDQIWNSEQSARVREQVRACTQECWMIGSVAPAMKLNMKVPVTWIAKAKLTGVLDPVGGARSRGIGS
jgi:Fe-coproporphyrin III synthase